ncbi:MAG TPA: nucleotidyltransferase domain-containing protein [Firmicutes bacterium]|nr:nucleotidyltransferase domain-containing protein [Bacillota bacterium]
MEDYLPTIIDCIVRAVSPDKIILFGSRIRGEKGPDVDYDILVVKRGLTSRRAITHQIYMSLADIPAAVDILVATPEKIEQERHKQGFVLAEAVKGRVVYER